MHEHLKNLRIGVVGATGLVGQEMLNVLAGNGVDAKNVRAFAGPQSHGKRLRYGSRQLTVKDVDGADFGGLDVVLLAVEGHVAAELAPRLADRGILVVDNSSHWRLHKEVPLVVPEVNPEDIALATERRIIANPNCSTIQMLVALAPLHWKYHALQVFATTYQSVSGAGRKGLEELERLRRNEHQPSSTFMVGIDRNVIPFVGGLLGDGYTEEERKMRDESRKILGSKSLRVSATCVRVPVERGHMVDVKVQFDRTFDMDDVQTLLRKAPGVQLQSFGMLTPRMLGDDSEDVMVGRLRHDDALTRGKGLAFVCTADNVRKGAALNAVQIVATWREMGFGPK